MKAVDRLNLFLADDVEPLLKLRKSARMASDLLMNGL